MFQQGYTIVFTEIRPIKINALVSLDGVAASVETSVVEGPLHALSQSVKWFSGATRRATGIHAIAVL